jgi:hypothetical protein
VFDANGGGTISWSGNPIMNTGTLPLTFKTNGGATNTITGWFNMNVGTGITFDVAPASTATNPGLLLSGGTGFTNTATAAVTKTGTGLLRVLNTFQAPTLNINQGTWEFGDGTTAAGASTYGGNMNVSIASGATLSYNTPAATIMDSGSTTFTGAGTILKKGTGTVRWNTTAGTFALGAGSLIDVQGGTFIGGSNSNEVWTNNKSSLNVASGATFDGSEANVFVDALTGAGSIKTGWNTSGGSITVGINGTSAGSTNNPTGVAYNAAGTATFTGTVAPSAGTLGSFVKSGAGTQILVGANTYGGTTTIKGGTLQIGDGVGGAGHTSNVGTGAIVLDGANSTLSFKNLANVTLSSAQTITGNGTLMSDKPLTLSGKITVQKSAVDNNANLTIKTTDTNVNTGSSDLNINAAVVKGDANNVSFTAESATSLALNGNIGNKTTDASNATGTLDVSLTSLGGGVNNNYSYGLYLNKVIDANGGVVTLTSTTHNSNAATGTAAVNFYNGSGITAGSFTVTGTQTVGNVGNTRQGISFGGTSNFTTTGSGVSKFSGTTNEGLYFMSAGIYTAGTINLDSGSNGGQIVMEGVSMPFTAGIRSEANINTKGNVTLGKSTAALFQRSATITAQTGTLNIIGTSVSAYNASAGINGSNGTTINLNAPSITLGSTPAPSEGGSTIGLAAGSTGFTLNISADNLNVNTGLTPVPTNNSGTGTTTIQNFTSGTQINIGGSDVAAAGATPATLGLTNAELNTFSAAKLVIGSSTAGDATVSSAVTTNAATGNVAVVTGGNIAINAALAIGGTKNLTLDGEGASSAVTQTAAITATGLEVLGTNAAYTLTNNSNKIGTLAGNAKSVNLKDSTGLTVGTVNTTTGLSTLGDITLNATSSVLDTSGIWVASSDLKTTGGNISLTGTNTASSGTSTSSFGVRMGGGTIGDANTGTITITGNSTLDTGLMLGATGSIQSKNLITLAGTGLAGTNIAGAVTSLSGGGGFGGGNAISITGTSTNSATGVSLSGSVLNNSSAGKTAVQSTQGQLYLSGTATVTNAATAGDIAITAGNGTTASTASINSAAGATITQNAAASVRVTTDGQGDLYVGKIIKGSGSGDVTVGAGVLLAAGATRLPTVALEKL